MDAIGLIGGLITTAGGIPQLIKIFQTKKADDLSWGMLGLWGVGLTFTLVYGVSTHQPPIYLPTMVSILETGLMCLAKVYYRTEYVSLSDIQV